jgi:uncharacterized delta-60 repeat protein
MKIQHLPLAALLVCTLVAPGALSAQFGTLDPSFNATGYVVTPVNAGDNAQKVLVQPDQKVLTVGMTFDASFTSTARVLRYMPDGALDTGFGTDGIFSFALDFEANLYGAVLGNDGKIILAGSTTNYQTYRMLLIRLNADGTLDPTFGEAGVVVQAVTESMNFGEDKAFDLTVDAVGNILVCGTSFNTANVDRPVVVRFTASGALDTSFGTNGVATIPMGEYPCDFKGIAVQPDGRIVAVGTYGAGFLWWVMLAARFEADGTLDTSFGTNGVVTYNHGNVDDEAEDVALLPDGSILLAGFTVTTDYNFSALLVKMTPTGALDATFGEGGAVEEDIDQFDYAAQVKVQPDGRIVMAGTAGVGPPNTFDMAVWKYTADGARDASFGTDGLAQPVLEGYSAMVYGMDVQADGALVVVGQARTPANQNYFLTARLLNDLVSSVETVGAVRDGVLYPVPAVAGGNVRWDVEGAEAADAQVRIVAADGRCVATYGVGTLQRTDAGIVLAVPEGMAAGLYSVVLERAGERRSTALVIAE